MFGLLELVLSKSNATGYKMSTCRRAAGSCHSRPRSTGRGAKILSILASLPTRTRQQWQWHVHDSMASRTSQARTKPGLRTVRHPPCHLTSQPSCHSSAAVLLVRTEKRKLNLATTLEAPTPTTFLGFDNTALQLPMAQLQPCPAAVSARAFATGAVAVALPASVPALQQAANLPALGRLPDGGLLRGR